MTPTTEEREAIATVCLMAAFADGNKGNEERARVKEIFDSLNADFSPDLYSKVLLGQVTLKDVSSVLNTPMLRNLTYEMAVGVCDADGNTIDAEKHFLSQLRGALELDVETTQPIDEAGEALAAMPLDTPDPVQNDQVAVNNYSTVAPVPEIRPVQKDEEVNAMVLKYAVLNGGLELLPQSLASMAIVPIQMKMVYRVGGHYGYQLDQGHIRELLAVVGVGMTSQVIEGYARKLVGGFVKKATGKKGKKKKKGEKFAKVAGAATGAVMSFASTYALGQVAKTYYAGGRQLEPNSLKNIFSEQVAQGKALYAKYRPQVENSARTTDLSSLMAAVKGGQV